MDATQRAQLAERVKQARNSRGWSQAKLAEEAGVSENTVLSIEQGDRNNQPAKVRAVLDTLGLTYGQAEVIDLDGVPADVQMFLTVAAQRLRVLDEATRSRVLADIYPRLLVDES